MTAAEGAGTAFDGGTDTNGGATQTLNASRQVTPGAHSLYFSLFDQGDQIYDSAVFLDNLVVGFVPNPAVNCMGGATPVTATLDLTPLTATEPGRHRAHGHRHARRTATARRSPVRRSASRWRA